MTGVVRLAAPAKINLRLVVLAREATGFHSLETILAGIGLEDVIEIEAGPSGIHLEVGGDIDTGPPEANLVVRAANLFCESAGIEPAVVIRLRKAIPAAAGLGGGSSDAASTLRGMNELHGRPVGAQNLARLAGTLGSDVPFFLSPTPFAVAWGHGERILALAPPPRRQVLVVHPGASIPTPAAFKRHAELRNGNYPVVTSITPAASLDHWPTIAALAVNDLYAPALEKIPALEEARQLMIGGGATISLLSGSGGALFGIFDEDASLDPIAAAMSGLGFQSWLTHTLTAWPDQLSRD